MGRFRRLLNKVISKLLRKQENDQQGEQQKESTATIRLYPKPRWQVVTNTVIKQVASQVDKQVGKKKSSEQTVERAAFQRENSDSIVLSIAELDLTTPTFAELRQTNTHAQAVATVDKVNVNEVVDVTDELALQASRVRHHHH